LKSFETVSERWLDICPFELLGMRVALMLGKSQPAQRENHASRGQAKSAIAFCKLFSASKAKNCKSMLTKSTQRRLYSTA
jgi:hypothetical protein